MEKFGVCHLLLERELAEIGCHGITIVAVEVEEEPVDVAVNSVNDVHQLQQHLHRRDQKGTRQFLTWEGTVK